MPTFSVSTVDRPLVLDEHPDVVNRILPSNSTGSARSVIWFGIPLLNRYRQRLHVERTRTLRARFRCVKPVLMACAPVMYDVLKRKFFRPYVAAGAAAADHDNAAALLTAL
jgi:hypothetical protein